MDDANQEPSALPLDLPSPSVPLDLRFWLLVVGIGGVGGLLLGQGELAALVALAGLFAASHASDLEPAHRTLYRAVAWIVPLAGVATFLALGNVLHLQPAGWPRAMGLGFAALGVALAAATAFTPIAAALARPLFRADAPSAALRLAARIVLLAALLYPVATITFPFLMENVLKDGDSLVSKGSLWGNMIGLALLAFGGVGFRIRRDLPATLERLGLRPIEPRRANDFLGSLRGAGDGDAGDIRSGISHADLSRAAGDGAAVIGVDHLDIVEVRVREHCSERERAIGHRNVAAAVQLEHYGARSARERAAYGVGRGSRGTAASSPAAAARNRDPDHDSGHDKTNQDVPDLHHEHLPS